MHAVIRLYSGPGAKALFDLIEERQSEVVNIISDVSGFESYTLIRNLTGGASVTVCADKRGTDESTKAARDWIVANAKNLSLAAPTIADGEVIVTAR